MKRPPRLDLLPSAADRWTTCMASPRFCLENHELIPADLSSRFSREGNTAHEVAAAFLQDRKPDPKNCPTAITPEMQIYGWSYMEYVESLRKPGSTLIVEEKKPLWYAEGRNAVVDAAVINKDSLHIVDYKYGEGVAVSPIENLQGTIYAYQTAHKLTVPLDFPVIVHIYQPRCRDNGGEPAHTWETTAGDIATRAGQIEAKAKIIQINHEEKGNPLAFVPSEKACRWCPAKGFCPERQKELFEGLEVLAPLDDQPKKLPLPAAITTEQLGAILSHKKSIEKWLADAEEYATDRLKEGHEIPGLKLVLSKGGHRYWRDPKKAAELLTRTTILKREEVIEESTISVAAAEKLLGKKKFTAEVLELIDKPPGKPVIAPADDPREAYLLKAESEFEVLKDEQIEQLDDY